MPNTSSKISRKSILFLVPFIIIIFCAFSYWEYENDRRTFLNQFSQKYESVNNLIADELQAIETENILNAENLSADQYQVILNALNKIKQLQFICIFNG